MVTEVKSIQQLKDEFELLKSSDNLAFIRFYENNIQSIDNIDSTKDEDSYDFKLRLICEYGLSLSGGGQYTKAVSILEKAITMFENQPNYPDFDPGNNSYLEHLLWNYGLVLWEVNQINNSIKVFKRLVSYYPENDKYRNWLSGLKARKIRRISNPLWVAVLVWLLGDLIIYNRFDTKTRLVLSIIGFILLVSVLLLELIIQIVKRKKSTKA